MSLGGFLFELLREYLMLFTIVLYWIDDDFLSLRNIQEHFTHAVSS